MQVRIDAAVQERHARDLDAETTFGVAREDLLGDRHAVVVDDEVGARDLVLLPEGEVARDITGRESEAESGVGQDDLFAGLCVERRWSVDSRVL